jgi:hypothetical protein
MENLPAMISVNSQPTAQSRDESGPAQIDEGDHDLLDNIKEIYSKSGPLKELDPHLKESFKSRKPQKNKKFNEGMADDNNTIHEVNIVKLDRAPSESDLAFITNNMKNHFFLSNLSPEEQENLVKKFSIAQCLPTPTSSNRTMQPLVSASSMRARLSLR